MQTFQADYFAAYRHLKLSRDDKGVLLAEFHSNDGPYIMNAQGHTEFVDDFHRIGQARANKIVILTGGGGRSAASNCGSPTAWHFLPSSMAPSPAGLG